MALMPQKENADWMAWGLQAALGGIVGAVMAVCGLLKVNLEMAFADGAGLVFGAAIFGAGLASLHGDALWLHTVTRVLPPDEPQHSPLSKFISCCLWSVGLCLIGRSLLRIFGVF